MSARLRQSSGADLNASGAVRIAGSLNFKPKYAPDFPRVRLVHTAPPACPPAGPSSKSLGVLATAPEPPAEAENLLATVITVAPRKPRAWPDYQRCLDGAPPNGDGSGPDRSRAGFTWCMTAIDWGWDINETADRLLELSDKAEENGPDYARRTAPGAAAAVERKRRRAG